MSTHELNAKQAQWIAKRLKAIEDVQKEITGGISLILEEAGLEGSWSLAGDGRRLEKHEAS